MISTNNNNNNNNDERVQKMMTGASRISVMTARPGDKVISNLTRCEPFANTRRRLRVCFNTYIDT